MSRFAAKGLALFLLFATPRFASADPPRVIVIDVDLGDAPYLMSKSREILKAGKSEEALGLALKAIAILESHNVAKHGLPLAKANFLVAEIHEERGEYLDAEDFYARAEKLSAATSGPDDIQVARALGGQGRVCSALGDSKKAIPFERKALAIAEKKLAPDDPNLADYLELLGEELDESGEHGEADGMLTRALAVYQNAKKPDLNRIADALHNLGARAATLGDPDKAIELLKQASDLRVQAGGKDSLDLAETLEALSFLNASKGKILDALTLNERALGIRERHLGPNHPSLVTILGNIGGDWLDLGETRRAEISYGRAFSITERQVGLILAAGSEREKLAYLGTVTPLVDTFIQTMFSKPAHQAELARIGLLGVLRYKGRALDALVDSVEILRRRSPPGAKAVLDDLHASQMKLSSMVIGSASARDPVKAIAERAALDRHIEDLEIQVSQTSSKFRVETTPVTLSAVGDAIPDDGALVEIYAYQVGKSFTVNPARRYVAFVLRKTGNPQVFNLGDAAAIDARVSALHDALGDPNRTDVRALARALDEVLFRPVRAALVGVNKVFLSPDRATNLIPFEALVDETDHDLIDRYTFTYLASGRDLLRFAARAPSRGGPLILANPDFAGPPGAAPPSTGVRGYSVRALGHMEFSALPGTAEEGTRIAGEIPGARLCTGAEATKAALFAATGPTILHVATHGFFLAPEDAPIGAPDRKAKAKTRAFVPDNPLLRSGIALAGANRVGDDRASGILTALEAAGLDLEGTRIVTLSACETGLGEVRSGDGVLGLRRALAIAGAETVVMSLWKVDDDATRDMMIAYYRRLQAGESRSEAMRAVKLELRKNPKTSSPYVWASFIVSGDPSPIEEPKQTTQITHAVVPPPVEPKRQGCACRAVGAGEGDASGSGALFGLAVAIALGARRVSEEKLNMKTRRHEAQKK